MIAEEGSAPDGMIQTRPRIGIPMRIEQTTNRFYLGRDYSEAVEAAGTGLPARVVQPVLAGLEQRQWVQSGWDEVPHDRHPHTRRRQYRLTADGVVAARQALAEAAQAGPRRLGVLRPLDGTT